MIDQTQKPSFMAPWCSSDAQVPIIGIFGCGQGSGLWIRSLQPHTQQTVKL